MLTRKRKERLRGSAMAKYKYTEEQNQWLIENAPFFTWVELARKFYEKFGVEKNFRTLKGHCYSTLNVVPHLNGYQKGQKGPNWQPIGCEYTTPNGYVYVKVSDIPITRNTKNRTGINWKPKQVIVWEEHNKKTLPKGYTVSFVDGDKTNYDISNLIALPRRPQGKLSTFMRDNNVSPQINKIYGLLQYENEIITNGINGIGVIEKETQG